MTPLSQPSGAASISSVMRGCKSISVPRSCRVGAEALMLKGLFASKLARRRCGFLGAASSESDLTYLTVASRLPTLVGSALVATQSIKIGVAM
jgi:hypothetical protein